MQQLVSYLPERAKSYKINDTTSGNPTQYVINKVNKEGVTCLLNSLPTNYKAKIYGTAQNTSGNLKMTVNAGVNQTFSIAPLTSNYCLLKVDVANSVLFGKAFFINICYY